MMKRAYQALRKALQAPRRLYGMLVRAEAAQNATQEQVHTLEAHVRSLDFNVDLGIRNLHDSLDSVLNARFAYTDNLIRDANTRLSDQLNLALQDLSLLTARQIEFQRETRLLLGQLSLPATDTWLDQLKQDGAPGHWIFSRSTLCRQESFEQPCFSYWMAKLGHKAVYHRKLWEFAFICQALAERGLLRSGARGLGFGVGEEPLSAYFASQGCQITGTDLAPDAAFHKGWVATAQHAAGKQALRRPNLCPDDQFDANVEFRFCDMNQPADDLIGYDFCWSACALEHLGSIEHGLRFIERSLDCLKPGGFAVHTTEFNVTSNDQTMEVGDTVLYRRRDMELLAQRVAAAGHVMAPLDLNPGFGAVDRYIDVAPYRDEPHLKLALSGYAATSIGLIIQKR